MVGSSKTYSRQVNDTSFRLRATVKRGTETVIKTLYLSTPGGGGTGPVSEAGLDLAALGGLPRVYALHAAAPNPMRAGHPAIIRFDLPETADVQLVVYDTRGRAVRTLASGRIERGRHRAPFELSGLADGVYVVRLTAGAFEATRSVTVVR